MNRFTKRPLRQNLTNKNKIMNTIKKYWKFISLLALGVFILMFASIYHINKVEAITDKLNAEYEYEISEAKKPSEIEKIQEFIKVSQKDIKYSSEHIARKEEELARDKKAYESIVWQKRCYEIDAQLLLIESEKNVDCRIYAMYNWSMDFSVIQIVWEEEDYKYLEKFSSYNIDKTKIELGLE